MHRILNSIRPSSSPSSDLTKKKAKLTVPPYIYLFFIQLDFSEPFRPEWLFYTYLCFYCFLALRSVKNSHFNFVQCIFIISLSVLLSQIWKYNDTARSYGQKLWSFWWWEVYDYCWWCEAVRTAIMTFISSSRTKI